MDALNYLLVFKLDDRRFAVALPMVERIVRSVEITQIPRDSNAIMGLINVQGTIIPVVDLRGKLGLSRHEMELSDQLVIVRAEGRTFCVVVDEVEGVIEYREEQLISPERLAPGIQGVHVLRIDDGMIIVCNFNGIFSVAEERVMELHRDMVSRVA